MDFALFVLRRVRNGLHPPLDQGLARDKGDDDLLRDRHACANLNCFKM